MLQITITRIICSNIFLVFTCALCQFLCQRSQTCPKKDTSYFRRPFFYHYKGKRQINSRHLQLGYWSNKSVRRYLLTPTFIYIPQKGAQITP